MSENLSSYQVVQYAYKSWSKQDWYDVMQTICIRLNAVIKSGCYNNVFSLMFPCSDSDKVDMLDLGSISQNTAHEASKGFYLTNLCGMLNGIFAFRDENNHVYRISPVYSHTNCKSNIENFVVTVRPATKGDMVFPLLAD